MAANFPKNKSKMLGKNSKKLKWAPTFFWKKVMMWNQLLPVIHNEWSNLLSKRYSIGYLLVLLVGWLKLVGTGSNELKRNFCFVHVEAPYSSTWERPELCGRSWLITFAHLLPLNENATSPASVHVSGTSIGCSVIFFIIYRSIGLEFQNLRFCSSKCPRENWPFSVGLKYGWCLR